jgi:hypothetical protein
MRPHTAALMVRLVESVGLDISTGASNPFVLAGSICTQCAVSPVTFLPVPAGICNNCCSLSLMHLVFSTNRTAMAPSTLHHRPRIPVRPVSSFVKAMSQQSQRAYALQLEARAPRIPETGWGRNATGRKSGNSGCGYNLGSTGGGYNLGSGLAGERGAMKTTKTESISICCLCWELLRS